MTETAPEVVKVAHNASVHEKLDWLLHHVENLLGLNDNQDEGESTPDSSLDLTK